MAKKQKLASEEIERDFWPCACVKRKRDGKISHIKMNHVSIKKCRVCKTTQAEIDELKKAALPHVWAKPTHRAVELRD